MDEWLLADGSTPLHVCAQSVNLACQYLGGFLKVRSRAGEPCEQVRRWLTTRDHCEGHTPLMRAIKCLQGKARAAVIKQLLSGEHVDDATRRHLTVVQSLSGDTALHMALDTTATLFGSILCLLGGHKSSQKRELLTAAVNARGDSVLDCMPNVGDWARLRRDVVQPQHHSSKPVVDVEPAPLPVRVVKSEPDDAQQLALAQRSVRQLEHDLEQMRQARDLQLEKYKQLEHQCAAERESHRQHSEYLHSQLNDMHAAQREFQEEADSSQAKIDQLTDQCQQLKTEAARLRQQLADARQQLARVQKEAADWKQASDAGWKLVRAALVWPTAANASPKKRAEPSSPAASPAPRLWASKKVRFN